MEVYWTKTVHDVTVSVISCLLSSIFALSAVFGNGIVMFVIWKKRELHSPSFALLFFLASSDFLVGFVGQPSFVAYKVAESLKKFNAYCNLRMIEFFCGWITSSVSFIILGAASVDRLLALTLHLRYKSTITVCRITIAMIAVWVFLLYCHHFEVLGSKLGHHSGFFCCCEYFFIHILHVEDISNCTKTSKPNK